MLIAPTANALQDSQSLRFPLNLTEWKDIQIRQIELTPFSLFQQGFLARLIIANQRQINNLAKFPWKFRYCLNEIFKRKVFTGYLDIDIVTCPPWYLDYPSDAKHQVLIKIQGLYRPEFWHLDLKE